MNMMLPRRRFLHLASAATTLPILLRQAKAATFPTRPVHIIVAFAPGGDSSAIVQLIGQKLQDRLGQSVVVENRPGAGGNVGTEIVVRSPADGYSLIWAGANNTISATLYSNLKFNFIRDIAMVGTVMRYPLVVAIHPSVPATTINEFIAYAKANPGKINMASAGMGTSSHLAGELFKMMTGVSMLHVPYRGIAPALADLVAGQVQVMFASTSSSIGFIRNGQLRALAVTTKERSPALPDVPAVTEFISGYDASGWYGVGAPKTTPAEVIAQLNKGIRETIGDPNIAARLADLGGVPFPLSPSESDSFVAADTDKWAKVVEFCGAKLD
jgi:tripartite-type tricarboxylate transporter receptor subunit TctC